MDKKASGIASLSRRERQVISLLAIGLAHKEIAKVLRISAYTVKHSIYGTQRYVGILEKLGARNTTEAAVIWESRWI